MDKNTIIKRAALGIILFICIINAWWFIAVPVGIIGCVYFDFYVESVIAGVMYDSLFGMISSMGIRAYIGTMISLFILMIISVSKKFIRK